MQSYFVKTINGLPADINGNIVIDGGSGGSQNFQSVTTIGNSTSNDFYKIYAPGVEDLKSGIFGGVDPAEGFQVIGHKINLGAGSTYQFGMVIAEGGYFLHKNTNPSLEYENMFVFPTKPDGTYTLATTDDITGGGTPQDLQSVLDQGDTAIVDSGTSELKLLSGTEYNRTISGFISDEIGYNSSAIDITNESFIFSNFNSTNSARLGLESGGFNLTQSSSGGGNSTVKFATPIATGSGSILNFPAKPEGTYTLATLEDVDLQKMSDADKTTVTSGSHNFSVATTGGVSFNGGSIDLSAVTGNQSGGLTLLSGAGFVLASSIGDASVSQLSHSISSSFGDMYLNSSSIVSDTISKTMQIRMSSPNIAQSLIYEFDRNKPEGTYTIATLDDISGGGGSQTLDQTLGFGNITDKEIIVRKVYPPEGEDLGSTNEVSVKDEGVTIKNEDSELTTTVELRYGGVTTRELADVEDITEGDRYMVMGSGKITATEVFNATEGLQTKGNTLDFDVTGTPEANYGTTFKFPTFESPEPFYTLATTADITLQQAVDNKGEYVSNYSGGTQRLKFFDYDGDRDPNFQIATYTDLFGTNIDVTPTGVQLNGNKFNPEDSEDYILSNVSIVDGKLKLTTSNYNHHTEIHVLNPTVANSIINFPSPIVDGTYTLATLDDLTLQNVLTTSPTATLTTEANTTSYEFSADGLYVDAINDTETLETKFQVNFNGIDIQEIKNGFSTGVKLPVDPIGNTSLLFPAKPTGTYTIATLDDISGGGGGGTLQSVLDGGKIAEFDGGNTYINLGDGTENDRTAEISIGDGVNSASIGFNNSQVAIRHVSANYSAKLGADDGKLLIQQQSVVGNGQASLHLPLDVVGEVMYSVPTKLGKFEVDGITPVPYVLATIEDIGLQKTIEAVPYYVGENGFLGFMPAPYLEGQAGVAIRGYQGGLLAAYGTTQITNDSSDSDDKGQVELRLEAVDFKDFHYSFDNTKAGGNYTIATLDDISGGGSPQNINQVLNTGNTVTDNIALKFDAGDFSGEKSEFNSNGAYTTDRDNPSFYGLLNSQGLVVGNETQSMRVSAEGIFSNGGVSNLSISTEELKFEDVTNSEIYSHLGTNEFRIINDNNRVQIEPSVVSIRDLTNSYDTAVTPTGFIFTNAGTSNTYDLPDKSSADGSYILATTDDIPEGLSGATSGGNTTSDSIVVQGVTLGSTNSTSVHLGTSIVADANTGVGTTQIGDSAGVRNTGDNATQLGMLSGIDNTGTNAVQIGYNAGAGNTGDQVVQIGQNAGINNTGDNVIQIHTGSGSVSDANEYSNVIDITTTSDGESSFPSAENQLVIRTVPNKSVIFNTNVTDNVQLNFPETPSGFETLATTEDVSIQGVLDNSNKVGTLESSYVNFLTGTANDREFYLQTDDGGAYDANKKQSFIYIENEFLELQNRGFNKRADISLQDGEFRVSQNSIGTGFWSTLKFAPPTSTNSIFLIPAKSLGTYTLATTVDITTSNLTANIGVDVPSTATSTGVTGQVRVDANYIYVCTATNTWVRTPLSTW